MIGFLVVKASGWTLIWPSVLIGLSWLLLTKRKVEPVAVPMLAVVIGHTAWIIVGNAIMLVQGQVTGAHILELGFDVVPILALTTWFLIRRSRAAAVGILVYQLCEVGFGLLQIGETSIPGISNQSLILAELFHMTLRAAGCALCIYAIVKLPKRHSITASAAN